MADRKRLEARMDPAMAPDSLCFLHQARTGWAPVHGIAPPLLSRLTGG